MNNVSVRRATKDDLVRVAELFDSYRQFYGQAADLNLAARFISARFNNNESVLFVASAGSDKITAFCQLYASFCSVAAARILTLYDLFTSPESRNLGLGRALLRSAEQYARIEGYTRLDLSTARTNTKAQALYESLGWKRDDVFFVYNRHIAP